MVFKNTQISFEEAKDTFYKDTPVWAKELWHTTPSLMAAGKCSPVKPAKQSIWYLLSSNYFKFGNDIIAWLLKHICVLIIDELKSLCTYKTCLKLVTMSEGVVSAQRWICLTHLAFTANMLGWLCPPPGGYNFGLVRAWSTRGGGVTRAQSC